MKRTLCFLLVMLIFTATAFASEIPQINANLFLNAKQAIVYLASGEYERLVTLLPFSDVSPSAAEWQSFVEGNFTAMPDIVQTQYSVGYWTGTVWKLAIPVCEPADDLAECLVLTSPDGSAFSGYGYAVWADVKNEYLFAPYVTWDVEYLGSHPVIAAD